MESIWVSLKKVVKWLVNIDDSIRDHKIWSIFCYYSIPVIMYVIWALQQPQTSRNVTDFWQQWHIPIWVWGSFFGVLLFILASKKSFKYSSLIKKQKARIRLLERFTPKPKSYGLKLIGDKSIYNSIIEMLQRAIDESAQGDVHLKLLLCSPALDYPGRVKDDDKNNDFTEWGMEFQQVLGEIISKQKVNVEIYYLPDEEISGFNALRGFLETLSNYCASDEASISTADNIFKDIEFRTNNTIQRLNTYDVDKKKKLTVNKNMILNIPFQIFISCSKNLQEVIVSFAGKEILEDKDASEPKGLHSIDAEVVRTFEEIYRNYVSEHKRMPLKPRHTLKIMEKHEKKGQHDIIDYLGRISKLTVNKGIFSPAVANSSKFTSYVLMKIIEKENTILDIGSGIGVQAIIAYKLLKELNKDLKDFTPNVWAIEAVEEAFKNLELNCKSLNMNIKIRNWELVSRIELSDGTSKLVKYSDLDKRKPYHGAKIIDGVLCEKRAEDNDEFTSIIKAEEDRFGPFDLVIADLPFVDTSPDNALERAFFDTDHNAHKTLLMMISHCNWFKNNGILLTSFSTLGGLEDLAKFDRLIYDCGMHTIQKFSFSEQGFLWIVYCIVREKSFDQENYWWKKLNVK